MKNVGPAINKRTYDERCSIDEYARFIGRKALCDSEKSLGKKCYRILAFLTCRKGKPQNAGGHYHRYHDY